MAQCLYYYFLNSAYFRCLFCLMSAKLYVFLHKSFVPNKNEAISGRINHCQREFAFLYERNKARKAAFSSHFCGDVAGCLATPYMEALCIQERGHRSHSPYLVKFCFISIIPRQSPLRARQLSGRRVRKRLIVRSLPRLLSLGWTLRNRC